MVFCTIVNLKQFFLTIWTMKPFYFRLKIRLWNDVCETISQINNWLCLINVLQVNPVIHWNNVCDCVSCLWDQTKCRAKLFDLSAGLPNWGNSFTKILMTIQFTSKQITIRQRISISILLLLTNQTRLKKDVSTF